MLIRRKARLGTSRKRGDRRGGVPRPPPADPGRSRPGRSSPRGCCAAAPRWRPTSPIRRPGSIRPSATRKYTLDRPLTDEKYSTTYNNFYEFGTDKDIVAARRRRCKIRPWTIKIDGMVEKPMTIDIDDLLKKMPLEERLYRHRCVEAWSMTVPWSGFPMAALVDDGQAARLGQVREDGNLHGPEGRARSRRSSSTPGPISKG